MPDMTQYSKKEFPSQTENRKQWILDTVRANQEDVSDILKAFHCTWKDDIPWAKILLSEMHKSDRDALLQPNGILTSEQIELLK